MKRITQLILIVLLSFSAYSQNQNFEAAINPTSGTWVIGDQTWLIFDNGVGTQNWKTNIGTAFPAYEGNVAALIDRQNIGIGNTSEDFLVSPAIDLPANPQLRFWARTTLAGNTGTLYQIRVAPVATTPDPTVISAYTTIQQWNEDELSATFTEYEEKVVPLAYPQGTDLYIAFVKVYTQTVGGLSGDRWLLDDIKVVSQCLLPTDVDVACLSTSATLNWNNPGGSLWEVHVLPAGAAFPPTGGTPIVTSDNTDFSVTMTTGATPTALQPLTEYDYYIRSVCTDSNGEWTEVVSCTTQAAPPVCGGNFIDPGGAGNYSAGENSTVTICPTTAGDQVTVTFTAFQTESNWDGLYVHDGNSVTDPLIPSANGAGNGGLNVPGAYWGTAIPGPFTSSSTDGCLTFHFISDGSVNQAGWTANVTCNPPPTCPKPTALTTAAVTATSVQLGWTNVGPATSWEVIAVPCGSPVPTNASAWVPATGNPFTLTGLNSATCYNYYVRGICGPGDFSLPAGPVIFTTQIAPPVCGGNFVDVGGPANYPNNTNSTVTVCPTNPGDIVTVTFTSFSTEANWDGLYVHDGDSTADPLIASANGAGNGGLTVPGSYWGNTIPGPFESSSADGCLTFHFISDGSVNQAGWVANVTCAPAPTCPKPTALTTTNLTSTTVQFGWTNVGPATAWEVIALPCGSPAPTVSSAWVAAPTNPTTISGLNPATCYSLYVRAVCSPTDVSAIAGPRNITTQVAPPVCGGNYVDTGGLSANYANNEDSTITICPTVPGEAVTVTFTSFNVQANNDGLYVFNGSSVSAPQIASTNGAGAVPGGLAGAYWGTVIPGPFTSSSADGCLTFRFRSSAAGTNTGWVANVTCGPAPSCPAPFSVAVSDVTSAQAVVSWTNPGTATSWEVIAVPCGSPAPTAASTGVIANTNPFTLTGLAPATCYNIFVRAICPGGQFSTWAGPAPLTTQIAPPVCGGNYVDQGGISANYPNNSNSIVTICPTNPGDIVTVTFTAFDTEDNWDGIYVYDGNSTSDPMIPSDNGPANGPMTIPGAYWGDTLPGPFTSTSVDGCLTFHFLSDGSVSNPGWVANITCTPPPTCPQPNGLSALSLSPNSAQLSWNQPANPDGFVASQWEIFVLPAGSPTPTSAGIATSMPYIASGLQPGTPYVFFVRAICSSTDSSTWAGPFMFASSPLNDECTGAIFAPVNQDLLCTQTVSGTLVGATGSAAANACGTGSNDDVWFHFTAIASAQIISLNNTGTATQMNFAVYSGNCDGSLSQVGCVLDESGTITGLEIGTTYFIRVYSTTLVAQFNTNFNLCISTVPCATATPFCTGQVLTYPNATGILPGLGQLGCLGSSPNPAFFFLQVNQAGPLSYLMTQSTTPGGPPNLDVDYALWGPFPDNLAACAVIPNGSPLHCSYSAAPTENFTIANAQLCEIYVVMITNFSDDPGFITFTQTNTSGGGTTACYPYNTFNYSANAYCQDAADPAPILIAGAVAGTYSSTPGLVIDPVTGIIDLSASTPGNYVVTSTTIPTTGGVCPAIPNITTIRSVTITAMPNATVAYSQAAYCTSLTSEQPITVSGTLGGSYSSTPGLFLNSFTGGINPSLSTPGIYTVTYTVAASGGCPAFTTSTQVEILSAPNVSTPGNGTYCDSYTLPALTSGQYYTGAGGVGPITDMTITQTQTIYVYQTNGICTDEDSFTVTINTTPVLAPVANVVECDSYALPPLTVGGYFSSPGGVGPITGPITTDQTVYVYAETGTVPNCFAESSFTVDIINILTADVLPNVVACDGFVLPALSANNNYYSQSGGLGTQYTAGQSITTVGQTTIYVYAVSGSCTDESSFTVTINATPVLAPVANVVACDSYALPVLGVGGYFSSPGGVGPLLGPITSDQTVYVYAQTGTVPNCFVEASFMVDINSTLTADSFPDVEACDCYVLPVLSANNTYWSGPNGTGNQLMAGDCISVSGTVYIFAQSGSCTDQSNFIVTINQTPDVLPVSNVSACDSYTLPALAVGSYFSSPGGVGPVTQITGAGDHTVYVYAQTGTTSICSDQESFVVSITDSPVVTDLDDVISCNSYELPAINGVGSYFSQSGGTGDAYEPGDIITQDMTMYVYAATGACSDQDSFTITISAPPAFTIDGGCEDNVYVLEATLAPGVDPANVTYEWTTTSAGTIGSATSASTTVSADGVYTLTVSVVGDSSCSTSQTYTADGTQCMIQKGISVDGDGHNDSFDLTGHNVTKLAIFNRYGTKVYERRNYINEWVGQSDSGEELPDGTYYYMIERDGASAKTGWIYINRAN
jgi:gliding motility-associated-like protein